jgi:T-complex protein 1 subunit gamma
MNNKTKEERGK